MYGQELKHMRAFNWKKKLLFTLFGESWPGHLMRFFVNRRYCKKYTHDGSLKILEMGSNNGAFVFWLSRNRDHMTVGLEYDKSRVIESGHISTKLHRPNLHFICADACYPFPLRIGFDIIFSTHVLEHILDDRAVLVNVLRNLEPGGVLILQVPHGDPHKKPTRKAMANGHVREGYTESNTIQKLEYAGFEIISATGSVGRIGRFAGRLAWLLARVRIVVNLYVLFFPITFFLIHLEQVAAFFRKCEPSFEYGPLVIARRPPKTNKATTQKPFFPRR